MKTTIDPLTIYQQTIENQKTFYEGIISKQEFLLNFLGVTIGIIALILGFSFWYQLRLNKETIKEIKVSNEVYIRETMKPLFINNITQMIKLGMYSLEEIDSTLDFFRNYFVKDREVTKELVRLRNRSVISLFDPVYRNNNFNDRMNLEDLKEYVEEAPIFAREARNHGIPKIETDQEFEESLSKGVSTANKVIKLFGKFNITD